MLPKELEKLIVDVLALLQTVCDVGVTVITGVGFTVTVKFCTGPKQLLA